MPKQAITDKEIEMCFDVMSELRRHLKINEFITTIRSMEKEGYKLAFIEEEKEIVAVSGYRICTNLLMGKHLYIDDIVVLKKYRSRGFGGKLLQWLRKEAINADCNSYHLDSGTDRGEAHKFYFKQGFIITSYHFSDQLNQA